MLIYSGFPPSICWVWNINLVSTELFVSPRPGRTCKFRKSLMGLRNYRKIFLGKISRGVKGLLCSLPTVCLSVIKGGSCSWKSPVDSPSLGFCCSRHRVLALAVPVTFQSCSCWWAGLFPTAAGAACATGWHSQAFPGIPRNCKCAIQDSPPCSCSRDFFLDSIPGDGRKISSPHPVSTSARGCPKSLLGDLSCPNCPSRCSHPLMPYTACPAHQLTSFLTCPSSPNIPVAQGSRPFCAGGENYNHRIGLLCVTLSSITSRLFNCMGKCSL